jgi:hypothetical protein
MEGVGLKKAYIGETQSLESLSNIVVSFIFNRIGHLHLPSSASALSVGVSSPESSISVDCCSSLESESTTIGSLSSSLPSESSRIREAFLGMDFRGWTLSSATSSTVAF